MKNNITEGRCIKVIMSSDYCKNVSWFLLCPGYNTPVL